MNDQQKPITLRAKDIQNEMIRLLNQKDCAGMVLLFEYKGKLGVIVRDHVDLINAAKILAQSATELG